MMHLYFYRLLRGDVLCAASFLSIWKPLPSQAQTPAPSGTVITVAGTGLLGFSGDNGPALNAKINEVNGLAVGADGTLYIADTNNFRIRAMNPASGVIRGTVGHRG